MIDRLGATLSRRGSSHHTRGEASVRALAASGTGSVVSRTRQMLPPPPVSVATPSPMAVPSIVTGPSAAVEGGAPVTAPSSVAEPVAEPPAVPDPAVPSADIV